MTVSVPFFGIFVAVIVSFFANYLYFGPKTMFPVWWRAMGRSDTEQPGAGQNMAAVFGLTFIASIAMALTMSWVIQAAAALYDTDITFWAGALIGASMGIGIAAATSLGHRLFAGHGLTVWVIEVGGDIIGLTLMGAVLSIYV